MSRGRIELQIVDIGAVLPDCVECMVRCFAGPVRIGDTLRVEGQPADTPFHVAEIRYYQQLVCELETNFGGQVLLSGGDASLLQAGRKLSNSFAGDQPNDAAT